MHESFFMYHPIQNHAWACRCLQCKHQSKQKAIVISCTKAQFKTGGHCLGDIQGCNFDVSVVLVICSVLQVLILGCQFWEQFVKTTWQLSWMSPWRWQELSQSTFGGADIGLLHSSHASGTGDTCYLLLEKGMWRSALPNYRLSGWSDNWRSVLQNSGSLCSRSVIPSCLPAHCRSSPVRFS